MIRMFRWLFNRCPKCGTRKILVGGPGECMLICSNLLGDCWRGKEY